MEIKLAVTKQGDRRKGNRRQSGDIQKITIRGEMDKEQEVVVRHEDVPKKKAGSAGSVWRWHEEFSAELNETYKTKKRKKNSQR